MDLPSFFLELLIIKALNGCQYGALSQNIVKALNFMSKTTVFTQLIDPANTNNVVSSDVTLNEKAKLAKEAKRALAGQWENFVW